MAIGVPGSGLAPRVKTTATALRAKALAWIPVILVKTTQRFSGP